MTDAQRRVVAFVQAHPRLLAALYDVDLTPDETVFNALWPRTVRIAALYAEAAGLEPPWLATRPDRPVYGRRSPAALARQRANATREGLPSTHTHVPLSQMTPALDAEAEACVRALEHSPESPAARARRRARETGEAPPSCAWTDEDPPCSCLDALPLMTMRDAPGNDAAAEAFLRATAPTSADPQREADAFIDAGAVYVMPDGPVAERAGEPMRRLACGCVPRFTLMERCAQVAEAIERAAIGSPIAQDTARRIRDAILALR